MPASHRLFGCLSFVAFSIAAAACSNNTPLSSDLVNKAGGGGAMAGSGTGSSGSTGSAGVTTGSAGGSSQGSAGAAGTATGGAAGTATGGATGTATGGATGTAMGGATGTATGGAGSTGQGGAAGTGGPGITMCASATLPSGNCASGAYKRSVGGACMCQAGVPCVCNGACTDPMVDDDNCGVCGNRCGPTSTCNNGVCGPPVANVLPARPSCGVLDVAVSGGAIFWTDQGHGLVQTTPETGSGITTIASSETTPARVAVVGKTIFWTASSSHVIRRWVGGLATNVVVSPNVIGGFVASPDATTVFFSLGTTVLRVPAAGGSPVVVAREEKGGLPRALALSGNTIAYPTDLNGDVDLVTLVDGVVASCGNEDVNGNLVMLNCARLARSQGELFMEAILAPPGRVIWGDGPNVKAEDAMSNGTFDSISMTNDTITGLAMTASNVYFADGDPTMRTLGVVYKSAITKDQVAIRLARGQTHPRSLATGATKVYWSTDDCTIESTGL
jgi:hypothetical protein